MRRECVRNPYSHFNIQQIVGGFVVRAIEVGCDSRTQKRLTIRAEEDIAVQAFAKREIDARHVIGHYHWATRIVRDVLQVLHQRIGDDPVLKWRSQLGANMVDFKVLALVRCERPNGPQVRGIDTRDPAEVKRRPKRRRRSSGA